ncbi:hypothetical protein [Bradyrhizobium canariense]|uniref:Uncharacterized protein n=1 Tax=Bradyrhizobium canariense TaxID=255045 RepID=A0A1H1QDY9_9BRAD|nr:hypothetical protein [Bradyrhizobium canariense]SDS21728.1 hypothetical protein SAMN05444158_1375 [Bradyrhizobium canariense]
MNELPNPFEFDSAAVEPPVIEPASAASPLVPLDPVTEPFPRGFDPERFLAEIGLPAFLRKPQPVSMSDVDLTQIIETLSHHL